MKKSKTLLQEILAEETKLNNAYIFTSDPMLHLLYDAQEAIDMFGEEGLAEDGQYVPPELIQRYKKVWRELIDINKELEKIFNDSLKNKYG